MIRLVATDVDGTLVQDSAKDVYPELIEIFKKLQEKGVVISVASGRQYYSLRRMFREMGDSILYIAENGAHIVYEGKTIEATAMDPVIVRRIIRDARELNEQYHLIVSTPQGSYIESRDEYFHDLIANSYCNKVEVLDDVLATPLSIIKISIFCREGMRAIAESAFIPKWKDDVKVCMAGEQWLDFMDLSVDKGHALVKTQEKFGISREETMAFGDNNNDVGLLTQASESYAVESAVAEAKDAAKYLCQSYQEKGVYQVLKERFSVM
ncbi:MAG: HAD family hydrolase [Eubacteriales bacterium]